MSFRHRFIGPLALLGISLAVAKPALGIVISTDAEWPEGTYGYSDLTVQGGATLGIAGGSTVTITGPVVVTAAGKIVLRGKNTTGQVGGVWAGAGVDFSAGSIRVDVGSSIHADSQGYVNAQGPGAGIYEFYRPSGGGYGGRGGDGAGGKTGGVIYGELAAPVNLGSGGGNAYYQAGAAGGGLVRLNVSGTLEINGAVSANGGDGVKNGASTHSAGGSGGGVYLTAATLTGAGTISANGGNASDVEVSAGAGGGGRIALNVGANSFSGSITAYGGLGLHNGGAGTIYTKLSAQLNGQLLISNGGRPHEAVTNLGNAPSPYHLIVTNAGMARPDSGVTLASVQAQSGGIISHDLGVEGVHLIVLGDVTVSPGGRISVDGKGYAQDAGPGKGTYEFYLPSGGGYGGRGGAGVGGQAGGAIYGSISAPEDYGSGGARGYYTTGGAGGGRIRIEAGGAVQVDGELTAQGTTGSLSGSGLGASGAGGSIYVTAASVTGAGLISANGADAVRGDVKSGAGGGGRIALYVDASSFSGVLTAYGGLGLHNGGPGTIYTKITPLANAQLLVSNGDRQHETVTTLGDAPAPYDLTVRNAGMARPEETVTLASVTVSSGGAISHDPSIEGVELHVQGDVTVEAGGKITVDGKGYANDAGPGKGAYSFYLPSGGGYGGRGGNGAGGEAGGLTYGALAEPEEYGSGGARGYYVLGGSGGGRIRIEAGGVLRVDGELSARGAEGTRSGNGVGGGGAGGSIGATAASLTGSGVISANGGNAIQGGVYGGAGGGGRIALYLNSDTFSGTISSYGGLGGKNGGAGTFFNKMSGEANGRLLVSNGGREHETVSPIGQTSEPCSLTVSDCGMAYPEHDVTLASVKITSGGIISHDANTSHVLLTVQGNVEIQPYGRITVDGKGYPNYAGLGRGNYNFYLPSGGAHGGRGGMGGNGETGGITYDSIAAPAEYGSGGGNSYYAPGGKGGGRIQMDVGGTLQVDGELTARGAEGLLSGGCLGAGGAGGGIHISASTLAGLGLISADGADATTGTVHGGGGGGGRIAFYLGADSFTGEKSARGGEGGHAGGPGTIYTKFSSESIARVLVSNKGIAHETVTPVEPGPIPYRLTVSEEGMVFPVEGLALDSLDVLTSGVISHDPATSYVVVTVGNDMHIHSGGEIDVDGKGYPNASGPGAGQYSFYKASGAGHGGRGGKGEGVAGGATYGNPEKPEDYGSGGGNAYYKIGGRGAGAARIVVGGALQLDGSVTANGSAGQQDGATYSGGGSGGSLLICAWNMSGAGNISALGGDGGGGGGGGRVALYVANNMAFPQSAVSVTGGSGAVENGENGTCAFRETPLCDWVKPVYSLLHGTEELQWYGWGISQTETAVDIQIRQSGQTSVVATGLPSVGSTYLDTTAFADGPYELRGVWKNLQGGVVAEKALAVSINNSPDVYYPSGTVTGTVTWPGNKVIVVFEDVVVANGGILNIEAGATVKFQRRTGIRILSGGALNAPGTSGSPIIMTSIADDTAGGDTNLDGSNSVPIPGDWNGIMLEAGGASNLSEYVELRYLLVTHEGELASDQTWLGNMTHHITNTVTIPSGKTLTIMPGAIVKFDPNQNLGIVVDGGTLSAIGAVAQPITFTSARDDLEGGDTNGDGNATGPAAGDWRWIYVNNGRADFDHVRLLYGGGNTYGSWSETGAIRTTGNPTITFHNSEIKDAFYDGILAWGGAVDVSNSVFTRIDRAICAHPGSPVKVANCTVHNNRTGLLIHGGTMDAVNTIVTDNLTAGVDYDFGALSSLRYCDVWGSGAKNYVDLTDPTGTDGNISVDPKYVDANRDDLRLNYGSPAIDAADSTQAPNTDKMGAPRYDDPRTPNTGVPVSGNVYADMGAFEFVETADSNVDLVVISVSGPSAAVAGKLVTVSWTVMNVGTAPAVGPWHDTVYLVLNPDTNPEFLVAGVFEVAQGLNLGPGETYTVSREVRVPGSVVGTHVWVVMANSRGELFEGKNMVNNTSGFSSPVEIDVPELIIGGPAIAGEFAAVGQSHWYKFNPVAFQDVLVSVDSATEGNNIELYVGQGYMPARERFDARNSEMNVSDVTALAAGTAARTYYVLVYPKSLSSSAVAFNIRAQIKDFEVTGASPATVGNKGNVTLKIDGGKLKEDMTYRLIGSAGTQREATSVFVVNSAQVYATFDMVGMETGACDVEADDNGLVARANDAVQVIEGEAGTVDIAISAPEAVRYGRPAAMVMDFTNTGNTDVGAPKLLLESNSQGTLACISSPVDTSQTSPDLGGTMLCMRGANSNGPAGILPPGATGRFDINVTPQQPDGVVEIAIYDVGNGLQTVDWDAMKSQLKPVDVGSGAWEAIFANFKSQVGTTLASYDAALAANATYLSRLGERVVDDARLYFFELQEANAFGQISQRYALGALGRGWPDPTLYRAVTYSDGSVSIEYCDGVRRFGKNADGSYAPELGDYGVLTLEGGVYRLKETNGMVSVFRADGNREYVEDANGNRITTQYDAQGRVIGFTDWYGATHTYGHNAYGRIATETDEVGRTIQYGYDASGEHLTSVEGPSGTIHFTYITGQGPQKEHAIESAVYPNGVTYRFEYDNTGRLTRWYIEGTDQEFRHTYDGNAVTIRDSSGAEVTECYDELMRLRKIVHADGAQENVDYSEGKHAARIKGANGGAIAIAYDDRGNPISFENALNHRWTVSYDPALSRPITEADPKGNVVHRTYDGHGNLTETVYPNGASLRFAYNANGEMTESFNARGESTRYIYDAIGRLIRKEYHNGSKEYFEYDAHNNLTAAGDGTETTTLSYDSLDRLSRIEYPSGLYLDYDYDALGRRTRLTDQDGKQTRYSYDSYGRLHEVRDEADNPISSYTHGDNGRLSRKDFGSGAYTTYSYTSRGRLSGITHYAPGGAVISQYAFGYDNMGRRTSMESAEGLTTYEYDAAGKLAKAALPDGTTLEYGYDAAGNRSFVKQNASVTSCAANSMNQCVAAGGASYQYDADGNLIRKTEGGITWHYAYDSESRLTQISGPGQTWDFEYNALGFRTAVLHNGQRTEYLIDPDGYTNIVGEYDDGNNLVARYVYGAGLDSRIDALGSLAYYHFDGAGNTRQITNQAGAVVNQYDYLPFGDIRSQTELIANPFTFAAQFGVVESGGNQYFIRTRQYEPTLGCFLSRDLWDIHGRHPYAYANSNPSDRVDIEGTEEGFSDGFVSTADNCATVLDLSLQTAQSLAVRGQIFYWDRARQALTNVPLHASHMRKWKWFAGRSSWLAKRAKVVGHIGTVFGLIQWADELNKYRILANKWHQGQANTDDLWRQGGRTVGKALLLWVPFGQDFVDWWDQKTQQWAEDFYKGFCPFPRIKFTPEAAKRYRELLRKRGRLRLPTRAARDPNDIIGPAGYGPQRYVMPEQTFLYTIHCENMSTATASAQEVVITHQVDPNLDYSTFELGQMGFGKVTVSAPKGLTYYSTRQELENTTATVVDITAEFDPATGIATWRFATIDPLTNELPADPFAGFLPPNVNEPEGEGFARYTIRPKSNLPTGSVVSQQARIVFDVNDPIYTPVFVNTIDAGAPSSRIAALPAITKASSVTLTISGTDDSGGSGIGWYDIYVKDNGGEAYLWKSNVTETTVEFPGALGHTYQFYSVAYDNVGHRESTPSAADAETLVLPADVFRDYLLGKLAVDAASLETLDLNDDGKVDVADLVFLMGMLE